MGNLLGLYDVDQNTDLVDKIIWSDKSQFTLNAVINRHNWPPLLPKYSNSSLQLKRRNNDLVEVIVARA